MARPLRIEYEGAYYHLLSRGNQQQTVSLSDQDRRTFLESLVRLSERFKVDIIAYVLMDNHYHMLIRTIRANLSKAMQWLGSTYTRIYNLRHSRIGHLFQGRFKSILVVNKPYLLQLSCYIHRNPLRGGLVQRLIDYPWSSYPAYAYNRKKPDWLKTDLILLQFGKGSKQHIAYREKMQRYAAEKKRIWEDIKYGTIYGSEDFVKLIKKKYLSDDPKVDVPVHNRIVNDVEIDEIIASASAVFNIDIQRLKQSLRIVKSDMINRDMLVYAL